jgi:hypothetical protein
MIAFWKAPVALAALLASSFIVSPASAFTGGSLVTSLPAELRVLSAQSVPFGAQMTDGICESFATIGEVSKVSEGEFVYSVDPSEVRVGQEVAELYFTSCQGEQEKAEVLIVNPFVLEVTKVVSPWAQDPSRGKAIISVETSEDNPVTVVVTRDGKKMKEFTATPASPVLEYKVNKKQATGKWAVSATSAGGDVQESFTVARKWVLTNDGADIRFPRCSTMTWAYSGKGAPSGTRGIMKDIDSALRQMSAASGVTFVRDDNAGTKADLFLDWGKLGENGPSGMGGYHFSRTGSGTSYQGIVQLNSQSWWVKEPGFAKTSRGIPGRGVLILHELGHAMGLGHVNDNGTLMNTVTSSVSPTALTKGDKDGLRYLYAPSTCQ